MTKSSRFLAAKTTDLAEDYENHSIIGIESLHGIHFSIILDKGPQLTYHFLKSFQKGLVAQVNINTTFHLHTDQWAERTIQTLEHLLRAYAIDSRVIGIITFLFFSSLTIIATIQVFA